MGIAFRTTLGPVVAVYGAINFLNKSLQVAAQRQVNVAKLTNGLKNLGGTAADLKNLVAAADEFGRATLFDQEDAEQAFAFLTSFQRIGVDSYTRVTEAAADLATVTGQDLNSAMTQLAKALEDPARRVTDLARSGTVFTEQQKEQIKTLQESGRLFEAQNLILQEIEQQYGGAAEAAGSAGLAGALDTLGEATRDFQEQLVAGTGAINVAESAIYALASAIDQATQTVRDFQTLITALDSIIRNLNIGLDGLAGVFELVNQAIIKSIPGLEGAILAYEQLLKLAGKYNDQQAGQRNFGANYASQEKALFEAAGGYTPYKPSGGRSGGGSSSGGSGGSGSSSATKELERQRQELERQFEAGEKIKLNLERQLELLAAGSDLEKERLQIAYDLEDTIAQIIKTAAPAQRDGLILTAQELARIKDAQAIVENTNWDEMSRWFEEQSAMTQELGGEYMGLADTIAGSMTDAFKSVIDGSKSAEEAFSDMLAAMAEALINYAMEAIAQYIAIGIARMFAGMGGGGGMAGPGGFSIPDAATPLTSGMSFFATGGVIPPNGMAVVGEQGPEVIQAGASPVRVANNNQSEALSRYSPSSTPMTSTESMPAFQMETTVINGVEYATVEQVQRMGDYATKQGAKLGEARTLNTMRNRRSVVRSWECNGKDRAAHHDQGQQQPCRLQAFSELRHKAAYRAATAV